MKRLLLILLLVTLACPAIALSFSKNDSTALGVTIVKTNGVQSDVKGDQSNLNLLQRVSWLFSRKHKADPLTDQEISKANSNATTGFIFSLLGLIVFPLFAIPGLIISRKALRAEKIQPDTLTSKSYTLAKAARVMGWIGIAITIILIPLIALAIALGNWH